MTLRAEVEAALAGSKPVSKDDYLRWAAADDLAVQARAYRLSAQAWDHIRPEPTRDEQCRFMTAYLIRCLVEDPSGDDVIHSGFAAGYELAAWLKHLSGIDKTAPIIRGVAAALAAAFKAADAATRNRIQTATLEHALEERSLRPFFADWAHDSLLAAAHGEALAWGRAHGAR
jgi:hypothetical protein